MSEKVTIGRRTFWLLALAGLVLGACGEGVEPLAVELEPEPSEPFLADVTVKNLIAQALGTTDGATAHVDGVRVFYVALPAAIGESGPAIDVLDAQLGTFTGPEQPLFVDPGNGDFRLQAGSPAIDAGESSLLPIGAGPYDLGGNTRTAGEAVDLGAYEYQNPG